MCNFEVHDRGIAIDLEDLEDLSEGEMRRRVRPLIQQGIVREEIAEKVINRFTESLKKVERKRVFNPDLVLKANGRYYVVEMQAWPVWLKREYGHAHLSWDVILNEGVAVIPRVLASKVKVNGVKRPVEGFYYITYSRGDDHGSIEAFFKELTGRDFKLMYISEIVRGSSKEAWFRDIIKGVRREVERLLSGLKLGEVRIYEG